MSKIDTCIVPGVVWGTASEGRHFEVRQRGALPVAPLAMPSQTLELPQRGFSRFAMISLAQWRRPTRAGR